MYKKDPIAGLCEELDVFEKPFLFAGDTSKGLIISRRHTCTLLADFTFPSKGKASFAEMIISLKELSVKVTNLKDNV
jgi:hypothetical protein